MQYDYSDINQIRTCRMYLNYRKNTDCERNIICIWWKYIEIFLLSQKCLKDIFLDLCISFKLDNHSIVRVFYL